MDSPAANVMYECSGGRFVPGKNLSLLLTVNSITKSKNVVTYLIEVGRCASNKKIRRNEIKRESAISQ